MKKNNLMFFLVPMSIAALSNSIAGTFTVTDLFYHYAQQRNYTGLRTLMKRGYSINTTNSQGYTPLCLALYNQDLPAYQILKVYGANTHHACVYEVNNQRPVQRRTYQSHRAHPSVYNKQSTGVSWNPSFFPYALGAAAVVGSAVALSHDGGHKSLDAYWVYNNSSNNPSHQDVTPQPVDPGTLTPVTNEYFETDEYLNGHFLQKINASAAYARFYGLDENGNLASVLHPVSVGVIDSGLYSPNNDFSNTSINGFNYDFGPCLNGNTTYCWGYDEDLQVATFRITDGGDPKYTLSMSLPEYEAWKIYYPTDYDWKTKDQNNFLPLEDDEYSDFWHGTHVAGIIAADKNDLGMHGVAFSNAKLVAGRWDFMSYPADSISRMALDAQIINMSFGVKDYRSAAELTDGAYNAEKDDIDAYILNGIKDAASRNVVMVMSAGNNDGKDNPSLWNGIPLLTDYQDMLKNLFITVVATGHDGALANYSNKCGVAQNYCIAAPGGDSEEFIVSTGTYNHAFMGAAGTSQAAPVVSGSIALLMGAYPYMSPQEIVALLFESADKSGEYNNADIYGNGMLDLNAATEPKGSLVTATGNSVDSGMINLNASRIRVPAVFQEAIAKNMPQTMVAFDKYKRPFNVKFSPLVQTTHSGEKNFRNDLFNFSRHQSKKEYNSENISFGYAPSAYKNNDSGLGIAEVSYKSDNKETSFSFSENTQYSTGNYVDKVLYNPYLAMTDAYSFSHKVRFDKMDFTLGFITGENGLYDGDGRYNDYHFDNHAYAFNAAASYQMSPELSLTTMIGNLTEDESLLGMNGSGALSLGDSATFYAGIMLAWQPTKSWSFSGAYYNGWTSPSDVANSMISTTKLLSNSFAFDGHYNFNETDKIGLQISSPLRIYSGDALFDIPVGRDNFSNAVYREVVRAHLRPSSREVKFALYHQQQLRKSVLLKSELAMRLHPEHKEDAKTDYRAMLGLSWDM